VYGEGVEETLKRINLWLVCLEYGFPIEDVHQVYDSMREWCQHEKEFGASVFSTKLVEAWNSLGDLPPVFSTFEDQNSEQMVKVVLERIADIVLVVEKNRQG